MTVFVRYYKKVEIEYWYMKYWKERSVEVEEESFFSLGNNSRRREDSPPREVDPWGVIFFGNVTDVRRLIRRWRWYRRKNLFEKKKTIDDTIDCTIAMSLNWIFKDFEVTSFSLHCIIILYFDEVTLYRIMLYVIVE